MADIIPQSVLNKSRLDKFILSLTIPPALKSTASKNERQTDHKSNLKTIPDSLQYAIYGIVVPNIEVPSIEVPQYGQVLKVSSHSRPAYGDVSVKFTVDNQFNNYWYIWRWLDILNSAKYSRYDKEKVGTSRLKRQYDGQYGSTEVTPENAPQIKRGPELMMDYQTDFTVYGLNEYNKEIIQFVYTKAFPISLGEVSYSYRDTGEIESSFTFSFTQLQVNLM